MASLSRIKCSFFFSIKYYFSVDESSQSKIVYGDRIGWLSRLLGRILVRNMKIALVRSIASGARATRILFPTSTPVLSL